MKNDLKIYFDRIRKGDNNAFSDFYEEMSKPIFTVILRIVKDYYLSEDIMQDLFVKLFLSPPQDSVKNPRAYVFQMAHNLSIDAIRKKESKSFDSIDDYNISTDGNVDSFLFGMDLEKAMMKLDRVEREIITFHLNCDLTFAEISKILLLSIPSVYRRYCKGIKKLKDELNGGTL